MDLHHIVLTIPIHVAHQNRVSGEDCGQHGRLEGAIAVAEHGGNRNHIVTAIVCSCPIAGIARMAPYHGGESKHIVSHQAEQVILAITVKVAQAGGLVSRAACRHLGRADKTQRAGSAVVRRRVRNMSRRGPPLLAALSLRRLRRLSPVHGLGVCCCWLVGGRDMKLTVITRPGW